MDLRRQIATVGRWTPLFVASILLAGFAAFLLSSQLPRVYEAQATIIVGQSLSAANPDYNQLLVSQRLSTTYASIATTRPILSSVIDQLHLEMTTDELASHVGASVPLDSTLLTISAQDDDPARAAAIANAVATELIAASATIQGREVDLQKSVDADLKATQDQIAATQSQVLQLSGLATRTPAEDAQLQSAEALLVTLRSTYASLLAFSSGSASNLLTIVEPAVPPSSPVSPRVLLNVLLAGMLGLLVAALIVVVKEYVDDTMKTPDDIVGTAGLTALGVIPRMVGVQGRSGIYGVQTLLFPRSVPAESYRTLRSNIEFASVDRPLKTLLVTSSVAGEGKTVTAANLAVVFAQAGRRVLLVDADFRRPGVHETFDLSNALGLTDLLRSDDVRLSTAAHPTEQSNLWILSAGPPPPNPAELLGSQRMRTVLDRMRNEADVVILDSPPLQPVTDAALLASIVDGTLLVVGAGKVRRGAVRASRDALDLAGANVFGAVLNLIRDPAHVRSTGLLGAYGTNGAYVPDDVAANGRAASPGTPAEGRVR